MDSAAVCHRGDRWTGGSWCGTGHHKSAESTPRRMPIVPAMIVNAAPVPAIQTTLMSVVYSRISSICSWPADGFRTSGKQCITNGRRLLSFQLSRSKGVTVFCNRSNATTKVSTFTSPLHATKDAIQQRIYIVSGKINHCIPFHNSGEQCRILTKFCVKNFSKICSACNIAGLVRSPKNSCRYRQPHRHVTAKVYSTSLCNYQTVQNVLRVLECKLEDVDATAWPDRFIDEHLGSGICSHSSVRRDFRRSTSRIRLRYTHALAASPKSGSLPVPSWGQDRTVGWSQSWNNEVWC